MNPKSSTALACAIGALLLISSCKKSEEETDNSPASDFAHSRPLTATVTNQEGTTTTANYHYNADGRSDEFTYLSKDTAVSRTKITGGDSLINYYYFNSAGEQYMTHQIRIHDPAHFADTAYADFNYVFDADHRIIRRYSYVYDKITTPPLVRGLQDSLALIWQDGNVTEERDLTGRGNSTLYEYYEQSNGASKYNIPYQSARWQYNPGGRFVASKNFVKKETYNGASSNTTSYDARFDATGRLKVLDAHYSNGTVHTVLTYECY